MEKDNRIDFSGLDLQKFYDTLAKILGEKYNVIIKFTLIKKSEYEKEQKAKIENKE